MMTEYTPTREEEAAPIWVPVVGLKTGEIVKLAGGLTYAEANKVADIEADKLAAQGKEVEWSGARRDVIHLTLRRSPRPEVLLPRPPSTFWGHIKWYVMPWTRPPLTPEQRWALKQLD